MPQLIQGRKWVYGWSVLNEERIIRIPPPAYQAYEFTEGESVLFIMGSKKSGGFGIARQQAAAGLPMFPGIFSQGGIGDDQTILISKKINCNPGERFLVVRVSGFVLSFLQFGPMVEEAENYPELETFLVN